MICTPNPSEIAAKALIPNAKRPRQSGKTRLFKRFIFFIWGTFSKDKLSLGWRFFTFACVAAQSSYLKLCVISCYKCAKLCIEEIRVVTD